MPTSYCRVPKYFCNGSNRTRRQKPDVHRSAAEKVCARLVAEAIRSRQFCFISAPICYKYAHAYRLLSSKLRILFYKHAGMLNICIISGAIALPIKNINANKNASQMILLATWSQFQVLPINFNNIMHHTSGQMRIHACL